MFKQLIGLMVLSICLSKNLMAQSVNPSPTEEQRDFIGRNLGGYTIWEQLLPLIEQLVTGKSPQGRQDKEEEAKKINGFIMQHPVLVLTLAKYFTSEELILITDFLASREFKNIIRLISNKLTSKDEKFKQDMNAMKEEVQTIFSKIKEQMRGKSPSSTPFTLSLVQMGEDNNPFEDKTNSIEKSLAARQLLEAVLPLAENIVKRKLRAIFKNEVEGVKISIAVSRMKENLKEHPMIIVSLVEYLDLKELNRATNFFSNEEIRSMVERISQRMSSENDQFNRDIQRCFFEMAALPFLQEQPAHSQNKLASFLRELFNVKRRTQQTSNPEVFLPKEPLKEAKLPKEQFPKKEPKTFFELRREGRKKGKTYK